jgi:hypothetical protein
MVVVEDNVKGTTVKSNKLYESKQEYHIRLQMNLLCAV